MKYLPRATAFGKLQALTAGLARALVPPPQRS